MSPRRLAIVALIAATPALARAENSAPMRFSVFWPCSGNAAFCAPRILSQGTIERDSDRKFLAFVMAEKAHRRELPAKPDVCFNSLGGDIAGAIALGRLIRKLGLNTCLAPAYSRVTDAGGDEEVFVSGVVCASACTVALVGGVNRLIENGSRFGIHQFYGTRGNVGDSATQVTVVVLAAFFEEMGISRSLLDAASLIPPKEIHWLSAEELRQTRVDNMGVAGAQWRLNALDDGTVVAQIAQVKPGSQSQVFLTVMKNSGVPVLVIAFMPGERSPQWLAGALDAVNGNELTLRVDSREIAAYQSVNWRVLKEAVVTTLQLSPQALQALRTGTILDVQVFVAHAVDQYDPSLQFPLEGMARFLSAVLR